MSILTNPKERTRFLRFAVVGAIGAVVDFGIFNLLKNLTPTPAEVAQTISFIAAVFSNFIWNRLWTYPDSRSKPMRNQLLQFFLINLIGWLIRTPVFLWTEKLYGGWMRNIQGFAGMLPGKVTITILAYNLGLATAVGIVMLWNFFVNRYWTYNDVK